LAKAKVKATPRRVGNSGGQPLWAIEIVTTVHGRSWARPLVAVALLLARGRIQAAYRKNLDEMAASAGAVIAKVTSKTPREAVAAAGRLYASRHGRAKLS
jgi:hypothetical protein